MFDESMHKEYIFCSYLLRLLPNETIDMMDIENALKLEFYKLEKTFKGEIALKNESESYKPSSTKSSAAPEKKEPLEEVIERINELFAGNFTESDKVILTILRDRLKEDKKLRKVARSSDWKMFDESIFPKTFDDVAQDSYVEQTEAFTALFENKSKYSAIMRALSEMLYKEFNK